MSTPAVGSAPYTTIPPCCAHLIADSTDFVFCTDDSIQPTGRVIRIDAFHLGCFIPFETNESHARRTTGHVAYDMQYNVADSTARRSAQAGEQALAVASTALRQSHARQNRATRGEGEAHKKRSNAQGLLCRECRQGTGRNAHAETEQPEADVGVVPPSEPMRSRWAAAEPDPCTSPPAATKGQHDR